MNGKRNCVFWIIILIIFPQLYTLGQNKKRLILGWIWWCFTRRKIKNIFFYYIFILELISHPQEYMDWIALADIRRDGISSNLKSDNIV